MPCDGFYDTGGAFAAYYQFFLIMFDMSRYKMTCLQRRSSMLAMLVVQVMYLSNLLNQADFTFVNFT